MSIIPPTSGRLITLAEGEVGSPRISGNGRVVVWNQVVDGNSEIMKFEDGVVSQVTHDEHPDAFASVSYDGRVVAWSRFSSVDPSDPAGNFDIYQNRDGVESPVATGPGNECGPAVSRDGRVIAWDDDGNGKWANFNIRKWQDGQVTDVTVGRGDREFAFLNGDGSEVYWRDFSTGTAQVWAAGPDGAPRVVLAGEGDAITPQISPDGQVLLWTDNSQGDDDLLIRKDGRVEVVAGERDVDETWARMSATGRQVVWTNIDRRDPDNPQMQILLKDGNEVSQVSWEDGGMHSMPDISEDGQAMTWLWVDPSHQKPSRICLFQREAPAARP